MKVVSVLVNGEKVAIEGRFDWQIFKRIRDCYLDKSERVVIERLK